MLDPSETPFLSRLAVHQAYNATHTWLTDVMNATAASGDYIVEGESAVAYALSDKTRETNLTVITDRVFGISGTEEAISHYGLDSQYAFQLEKAMKELKIKIERNILGATGSSAGGQGYARSFKGAFYFAITGGNLASGAASVSALTESIYNTLCQDIFTDGGNPDTTLVNGFLKRRISAFASNNTRNIDMTDNKKLTGVISYYESDFGVQEIVLDRWCKGLSNGETGAGLVLEIDKWAIAYLRKPFTTPLAIDGDRKRVQILAEYTLECLAAKHNGYLSAFATA